MHSSPSTAATASPTDRSLATILHALWQLSRPRIVALVALTTVVGAFSASEQVIAGSTLFNALLGSTAVVIGAIALNQRIEHRSDTQMPRTAGRPLPTGRLTDREVTWYATGVTLFGLAYLAAMVNLQITLLAAVSWLI